MWTLTDNWRVRLPKDALLLLASVAALVSLVNTEYCAPTDRACWPGKAVLDRWSASLSNVTTVIMPTDTRMDEFLSEATAMNMLKSNYPAIIVVPGTEGDLRSAVVLANQYRIRVVARCSGHDFNGRSSGNGVMLVKTERLKSISYSSRSQTITFASGVNHGEIYSALVPYKRMYVGGQTGSVCPAGCLAGGCHGVLSRKYGLGIDNILQIRILLFNGTIITANQTAHSSLFHAYLGAGQNTFGIALSFTARTYPAPPGILELNAVFKLVHPSHSPSEPNPPNLLSAFFMNVTWWASTPRELAGNVILLFDEVYVQLFYSGSDYNTAQHVLEPLLTSSYIKSMEPIKNHSSLYAMAVSTAPAAKDNWQRKFLSNAFVPPNQDVLNAVIDVTVKTRPYMWLLFIFGGAVQQGTNGVVAPGMRSSMYEMLFTIQWDDPHEDVSKMEYVQAFLPLLYGVSSASYNNEWTTWGGKYNVMSDWKTRFYDDYNALLAVKQQYDPCNVFTSMLGPGWDRPAATCSNVKTSRRLKLSDDSPKVQ